jgi:hypothetical protein
MESGRLRMISSKTKKMMKDLKADLIRMDGRLERHCKLHGIGHTVGHIRGYLKGSWETIHGCCSCHTNNWPCQEIKEEESNDQI